MRFATAAFWAAFSIVAIALFAILWTVYPRPAVGHSLPCMALAAGETSLAVRHGETKAWQGHVPAGDLVVALWTNEAAGTWTLVFYPAGDELICTIASGHLSVPPPGEPA